MRQTHQINQLDKTNKANKSHRTTLGIITTLVLSTIVGIGIYSGISIANTNTTNALSYSTNEDISFTFKPTLSIGLSTDSLTIDNLVPGTTSDSNTVTVTVSSNTPYGYVLSAGVGSTVSTDPYYNTSDLVHDNTTTEVPTTNKFSSIATSASLPTLDTDNTWGYSTSTNGGTSWSTYSGLSNTTTKPLLDISDPATPSTIDFKIAARSATTQASGTYNNVITFYAVGKPEPPTYMQDTATIKAELQNIGDEMQAVDIRDGKEYWVTKQADGKIWMTQNLDLCIGCDDVATLTSQNTDLNTSGSGAYQDGYTIENDVITWSPVSTAITSNRKIINGTTMSPGFGTGTKGRNNPYSGEGGNIYVYTSNSIDDDIVYDSLAECIHTGNSESNCTHYHVGNYYNWTAVIASNDSSILTSQFSSPANSICPSGWRLPKGKSASYISAATGEFWGLFKASGITDSGGNSYHVNDGFNKLRTSPLYFVRSGFIGDNYIGGSPLKNRASYGYYWSSTINSNVNSHSATFTKNDAGPTATAGRLSGLSVRCMMR